jgi:hypothetical protein
MPFSNRSFVYFFVRSMAICCGSSLILTQRLFLHQVSKAQLSAVSRLTKSFRTMSNSGLKGASSASKNASDQYQKLSQLEHILKRPDTYIGSTEHQESVMWIYDESKEQMVEKNVKIVPGLFKIFDEILVNAADQRSNNEENRSDY